MVWRAATPPGGRETLPNDLVRPGDWAALTDEAREVREVRERRLMVGSRTAPVDRTWKGISHNWLPKALTAPTPAREVPAAPPPSPSTLLLLSEVSTARAGREDASLYNMAALGTGGQAWWGSAPSRETETEKGPPPVGQMGRSRIAGAQLGDAKSKQSELGMQGKGTNGK